MTPAESFGLNWIDFAILIIVLVSAGMSLLRGFFREAISLVTWILAFWIAIQFSTAQAELLARWIETPSLRLILSFSVLFLSTLIVGSLLNRAITNLVDFSGLGGLNHLLGLVFGAARGLLIVTVLVLLAEQTILPHDAWWQESILIELIQKQATVFQLYLPEELQNYLNDFFSSSKSSPQLT